MDRPSTPALDLRPIPEPVRQIVAALAQAGHAAYLVGGCVRDLLRGEAIADFDVATSASPDAVLSTFARAIPIGLRHGTVMIPTGAGPVDVTSFRAGPSIEDDLACRDFTINAIAYDPREHAVLDPFGGRVDLARRRLVAVRSARDRFREDPLRALRAARLAVTLDLAVDPAIEPAMGAVRSSLQRVARERIRHELRAILLSPRPAAAIGMLRRSGIEEELLPGAPPDAAAVVEALPPQLEVRLAGWLRGTNALRLLRGLRFPERCARRVDHLVRLHPIESGADPGQGVQVRRLLKRAGDENFEDLLALRASELSVGAAASRAGAADQRERLRELQAAVDRARSAGALALQRRDLALGGREVMEILGCAPGPAVGEALDFLTDRVIEDPARNTPRALRALLESWQPSATPPPGSRTG